jgi:hypothetical protein
MRICRSFAGCLTVVVLAAAVNASEPPKAALARKFFLDPQAAGVDFEIQGEYVGLLPDGERYGVAVIALGDGAFRAVGFHGGLPGAGWDGSSRDVADGKLREDAVQFRAERGASVVAGGVMKLFDPDGNEQGQLEKTLRKSPTLGMAPPEGAVILFDGKSAAAWRGTRVRDGLLQVGGQTQETFEDFRLHLEFQTPFMPYARGQDRGNSGVFLQRRYEIQILDSFGLEGATNECGAIYGFRRPDVNMCFPPLSWQTFDIDFTMARFDPSGKKTANAHVTVRHNGVVIHDDVELTETSDSPWRIADTPQGGPLYLQYHGCPVQFRNIWLVRKGGEH